MICSPKDTSSSLTRYISWFMSVLLIMALISPSMGSEQRREKSKSGIGLGTVIGIGIAVGTILKGSKSSGEVKSSRPKSRSAPRYKPEIVRVQDCLNKLGFAAGKADGIAGRATRKAFAKFASQHGMAGKSVHDKKAVDKLLQECEKLDGKDTKTLVTETGYTVTAAACKDDTWRYKNRDLAKRVEWVLPTPLKIDVQSETSHGHYAVPGAENFLGALGSLFGLLDIVIDPSASNVAAGVAGVPTSPMGYAGYASTVGGKITHAAKRIGDKMARKLLNLSASFQWQKVTVKCGAIEICKQGQWVDGGLWPLEKPHMGEPYGRVSYTSKHNPFDGKTLGRQVGAAWRWYSTRGKVSNLEKFNQDPCQSADASTVSEGPKGSTSKQKDCRNCDDLKKQIKQVEDEISRLKSDREQLQNDLKAVDQTEMDEKEKLESNYRKCVQRARERSEEGMIHGAVNKETGHIIGTTDPADLSGLDPNVWDIYDGGDRGKSLESQKGYKEKMFKAGKERCDKMRKQGLEQLQNKLDKKRQSLKDKLQKLDEELGKAQRKLADLQKQLQVCMQGCNRSKE